MTHDHGFRAIGLGERSDFHVALLSVRNGQHATVFRVERAQAVRIVAGVEAIDQCQIREVIDIGFDGEDDDHPKSLKLGVRISAKRMGLSWSGLGPDY
jgi:hypothetical protein